MLVERLLARAAAEPDAAAFVVGGGDSLTYRMWNGRSEALSQGLLERGVRPGDRVVLWFEARDWCDFAVAYAGVHQAGAIPVLVPLGPKGSLTDLRRIVGHSGASVVVGSAELVPPTGLAGALAWIGPALELEDGHDGREHSGPPPPGELAEISYRSGPLRPLQVARHGCGDILSELAMVDAAVPGLGGTPFLHAFPPGSEGGRRALWIPLGPSPGAVVTLASFDPEAFCALAAEHGAARWILGPSAAGFILDSGVLDSGALDGHDLSSLVHLVLLTGQASPALLARLGSALPRTSLLSLEPTVSAPVAVVERGRGESDQNRRVGVPVAFSQEGMLWHEQFAPGSQNLPPLVRRYRGPLDVGVLERALAEIVRRHEPLRTTFEMRGGRPVQIVAPPDLHLARHDLENLAPDAQEPEVAALLADLGRPFDLVEGPLFEAHLVRLGPGDHLVAFRVHHSVYDDWSVSVFRRELSALYTAFLAGRPSPLDDLPLAFGDFSRAQHRRMEGPAGAAELSWWKEQLAGAPLCLQLPIDDPDRPQGAFQASAEPVSLELSPELAARLRALARRERTTLFMTMTAAFQVLLQRGTGQEELLLATVVANRNRTELEPMIGCFTKKVLLRLDGTGDPTFAELLPRVRAALLGALAHQDLPFETVLQQSLSPAAAVHGLVPHPVVMLQGVTPQTEEVVLPGLTTSGYQTSATTTRTHFSAGDDRPDSGAIGWGAGLYLGTFLILSVIEEGAGVSLSARGAFHGPSVERLLATFVTLLADIVAHPSRRVSELRLLDDRLQAELVGRGDDGDARLPGDRAHEIFQAQARRTPSRLAVHDGDRSLTYAHLDARAHALADRLRGVGVGRGDLVGLCMATSADSVVAVLAVWKAGAGYVALDAEDTDARHRLIVERASLAVVVTQTHLGRSELEGLAIVVVDDDGPGRSPLVNDSEAGDGADVGLVFYGSGPSAVPHGVVIEHGGVVNLLAGLRRQVLRPSSEPEASAGLRVCLAARPTDDAFLRQLLPVLDGHILEVVARGAGGRAAEVVALVGSGRVDLVDCPPGELDDLVDAGLSAGLTARPEGAPTPVVVVGSRAPIGPETQSVLASMDMARTYLLYGPPECSFGAAVVPAPAPDGRIPLGRSLGAGMAVVLDAQGRLVPEGVTGELHLAGPGLSPGYLGEAEATARRFVALHVAGEVSTRLFKTGQRARYLPGARIELVGRVADMVDLRGFHVDRARMAAALRQCRGVAGVEVVVDQDGGEPHLVALVVPEEGSPAPTLVELRTELWSRLPGYAWPASVIVVPSLSGRGGQPWPADASPQPACPESPEARLLASLWAEARGVEQVEVSENYWQSFSFLDAMALAGEQGVPIGSREASRNRVLATLATALAAGQLRPTGGDQAAGRR